MQNVFLIWLRNPKDSTLSIKNKLQRPSWPFSENSEIRWSIEFKRLQSTYHDKSSWDVSKWNGWVKVIDSQNWMPQSIHSQHSDIDGSDE